MLSSRFLALLSATVLAAAHPSFLSERDASTKGGVVIKPVANMTDTSTKPIPDADHPYIAPGKNDLRGPCPGLNTLANHGYIPRNGVASFEQIVSGAMEAFNMELALISGLTAFGMLARGNAFTNQLSIGGATPLIPPLPGMIDGPVTGGLAKHGRFEGDVSMTREDFGVGDYVNFQQALFDTLLTYVGEFGDDDPITGNRSVVTPNSLGQFKYRRFVDEQKEDRNLEYHVGRFTLSYGETGFTLNFFANGTTGKLSVPTLGSFFRNQTFPPNWHRHDGAVTIDKISDSINQVVATAPLPTPGANNNATGEYVPDTDIGDCDFYLDLASQNLPAVLVNTTGILKQNVDFLTHAIFNLFSGSCNFTLPAGPAGV